MSGPGFGRRGLASIWAPANQDSSHVGNAGVGVISMKGAPLALPTFATAQFRSFFGCGRAVRCMLPLGFGRFMHLVFLYGEQLALTEQLFDAALGELSVVWRGQPCVPVGDFNEEPTNIPCLAKGIRLGSGSTLRLLGLWLLVGRLLLLVCVSGILLVVLPNRGLVLGRRSLGFGCWFATSSYL